jgi:hypothetical protein
MKKPFKYTVICDKTGKVCFETNRPPLTSELQTWEQTNDPSVKILKQTKTAYIDLRYEAKIRLYNYISFTKKGLEVPTYQPFKNTQIGVTIPILNF